MILSVSNQAMLFLMTIVIGFTLAFFYDWLRIFRRVIPHYDWITYVEDIVYWMLLSILVFFVLLRKNYGEIRFFAIAGVLIGMVLYFATLSHLFLSVSMAVINFIKKVILLVIKIILSPIKLVLKLLSYPYSYVKKNVDKSTKKARKGLRQVGAVGKRKARAIKKNLRIILKKH